LVWMMDAFDSVIFSLEDGARAMTNRLGPST
jgi:hypothetical protein